MLLAIHLLEIDIERIRKIEEIIEYISEFLFEMRATLRIRHLLRMQSGCIPDLLREFSDLFNEKEELLSMRVLVPATLTTDGIDMLLEVFEGGSFFEVCHGFVQVGLSYASSAICASRIALSLVSVTAI